VDIRAPAASTYLPQPVPGHRCSGAGAGPNSHTPDLVIMPMLRPVPVIIRRALKLGTGEQVQARAEESSGLPLSAATRVEGKPSTSVEYGLATAAGRAGATTSAHPWWEPPASLPSSRRRWRSASAAAAPLDRVTQEAGRPHDPTPGRDGPGWGAPRPDMVLPQSPIQKGDGRRERERSGDCRFS